MAIQKRLHKIWNGIDWVEIQSPTSADLVDVNGTPLDEVLATVSDGLNNHSIDPVLHTTTEDKSKLANLPADANASFSLKTELTAHEADTDLHKTEGDTEKLANLAVNANSTYATKAELAGKGKVYVYETIVERDADLVNFTLADAGAQCWVKDPSDDVANIPPGTPGPTIYVYTESSTPGTYEWQFVFQMTGADIALDWDQIEGKPSSSTESIDQAVTDSHTHDNKTNVLDKLSDGGAGIGLLFDGNQIGSLDNRVFLQEQAPSDPRIYDIWFAPVPV